MILPYEPGDALTCQQIRELDVLAIEHVGIPGLVLMENAGRGVAAFVAGRLFDPGRSHVLLLCGPGNNGGDGFVAARHLHNAGIDVTVALAVPRDRLRGDAAANLAVIERMGLRLLDATDEDGMTAVAAAAERADVIVDALLGTGATGTPRGTIAALIELSNVAGRARRVAVDVPSGLDADSGAVGVPCFRADATVTLLAPKVGFARAAAREVLGRVVVVDIGLPRDLIPRQVGQQSGSGR